MEQGSGATQPVHHGQPNEGHIEDQHSTEMGDAGVESFECCPLRGQLQHSPEDEDVGEASEEGVDAHDREDDKEPVHHIDRGVSTGQLHNILVQTEGVCDSVLSAVGQPLQDEGQGEEEDKPSAQGS